MDSFAIALDLGGTQLRAALVNRRGQVLKRISVPTAASEGPGVVIQQLSDASMAMSDGIDSRCLAGVGLSAPGPLNTLEGIALSMPTIRGFQNIRLRERLEASLQLPVWIENDGTAAALGEWRFGAGAGLENLVYITVSTGIGGGIVADNRLLRGRLGMAGEVGHMTIIHNGERCSCGNQGCWEAYASGTAFTRRARIRAAQHEQGLLSQSTCPIEARDVFAAAAQGDPLALELVAEVAELLGLGITNLLHLYSPEAVIVGGGMAANFEVLHPVMRNKVQQAAMNGFSETPILRAALGDNSGLVGAAALVFDAVPANSVESLSSVLVASTQTAAG